MLIALLQLAGGFVLLTLGAEALVRGASGVAARLGVAPLVIGLTIVAFGTSAPELAVSVGATLDGSSDIAIGNVVGSNIFNVLVILGLSALVAPLVVHQKLVQVDAPIMIAVSFLLTLLSLDGAIGRIEGSVLVLGLAGYTMGAIRSARREPPDVRAEYAQRYGPRRTSLLVLAVLIGVGLACCVGGARLLVDGSVFVARRAGVSELVIGLTIVAAGTSLPELATSLVATIRGERDIAVGNIVGSNIFNILGIAGVSAIIAPTPLQVSNPVLWLHLPVMLGAAIACLPIFFTGHRIGRLEAAALLVGYLVYSVALALTASPP